MIKQTKNFLYVLAIALVCLTGCGKDGDPGAGFSEAVKYGNIKVTFSGKRPTDNVDFKSVEDFKFLNTGNNPSDFSSIYTDTDTDVKTFSAYRYLSGVDEHTNDNYFEIYGHISSTGELTDYEFGAYTTIIDGTKYFGISQYIYSDDTGDESEIKDFKYDATTGRLTFTFTWTAIDSNSTGSDLKMEGKVDVILLEALNDISND